MKRNKTFSFIVAIFVFSALLFSFDEDAMKKFSGEVLFVNGDWVMINFGAYHNLKDREVIYIYRNKRYIGSVIVRKIRNLHCICKIKELTEFHILEGDTAVKDLKNIKNLEILKLSVTLTRLNSLKSRMETLLKNRYPAITNEELAEFIELFYIRKGVIFDLTSGTDHREVVSAGKDPSQYIKQPLWIYYRHPGDAKDLIMYNEISYEVWKQKLEEFVKYMEAERKRRKEELERRLFVLKRENDIKANPYYQTFLKYFGEPDMMKRKFYSRELQKFECSWKASGVYAEFVNNRLVRREKYKNSGN